MLTTSHAPTADGGGGWDGTDADNVISADCGHPMQSLLLIGWLASRRHVVRSFHLSVRPSVRRLASTSALCHCASVGLPTAGQASK